MVLLNLHHTGGQYLRSNITVHWDQVGLPPGTPARVRDLYAETDLGVATGSFTATVWAHDVVALRISPLGGSKDDEWRPWHQQPIYRRNGAAAPRREDLVPSVAGGSAREQQPQGAIGRWVKRLFGTQHPMFA